MSAYQARYGPTLLSLGSAIGTHPFETLLWKNHTRGEKDINSNHRDTLLKGNALMDALVKGYDFRRMFSGISDKDAYNIW